MPPEIEKPLADPLPTPPSPPSPPPPPRGPRLRPLPRVLPAHAAVAAAEQYRLLAQRLEPLLQRGRRIGITSPCAGEGRTTTAINTARALLRASQRRVVLVDAHLRSPAVARALGLLSGVGLADVVAGSATLADALTAADGLTVLPAGATRDPAAAIASPRLREILAELAGRFDAVIVDTAPVLPLADVPTLAAALDGLLLVLRAGRTRRDLLRLAVDALPPDRLLGCVLNGAGPEAGAPFALMAAHDRALRRGAGG
jgi:tyrosine-protein kinase